MSGQDLSATPSAPPAERRRYRTIVGKQLDRLRLWLARRAFDFGIWLEPPERGEPCVDCGMPLPAGYSEDECPTCVAQWEQQRREESIYNAGAQDEYERFGRGQEQGNW